MNTIGEKWLSFDRLVLPANAGHVQRQETRRAFYQGAKAMLVLMVEVSDMNLSKDAAAQMLQGVSDELDLFFHQLGRGT